MAAFGVCLGYFFGKQFETSISKALNILTQVLFAGFMLTALAYLAYPSVSDHVESTIATLGVFFKQGRPIYPGMDSYDFHGLLYGPGLSELQAGFMSLGLPIITAAKMPGVLAFISSVILLFALLKNNFSKSYLLLLLPYGLFVYFNRAEPLFILLVSLTLYVARYRAQHLAISLLLGILAGMASSLKLHGALYVLAAALACPPGLRFKLPEIPLFALGGALTLALSFSPQQVSYPHFAESLALAGKHGLSSRKVIENLAFLLLALLPFMHARRHLQRNGGKLPIEIYLIAAIEVFVAIIGAKPGAGPHHLLPLVVVNAYCLDRLLQAHPGINLGQAAYRVGLLLLAIVPASGTLYSLVRDMANSHTELQQAQAEILMLADKFPGTVLGLSDSQGYPYTFFRPLLEARGVKQIDYPTYMDLNFSGLPDTALWQAMRQCAIPYLALPRSGAPFSMNNSYTSRPLFSDQTRLAMKDQYTLVHTAAHYAVYACNKPR